MKLGWVDPFIGVVDHVQYFCPGTTLMGVAAHPNSQFNSKTYLFSATSYANVLDTNLVWGHLKHFDQVWVSDGPKYRSFTKYGRGAKTNFVSKNF